MIKHHRLLIVKQYDIFDLPDAFGQYIKQNHVSGSLFILRALLIRTRQANHAIDKPGDAAQTNQQNDRLGQFVHRNQWTSPRFHQHFASHTDQSDGMIYIVDDSPIAASRNKEVGQEARRANGQHHAGKTPKDVHIQH